MNDNKKMYQLICAIVIGIVLIFGGSKLDFNNIVQNDETSSNNSSAEQVNSLVDENSVDNLKVHFIDVGQADSILITQGTHSMLIDAGTNDAGSIVVDYLNKNSIKKLDYVIGTHVHEDHIGGMDDVINNFDEDTIIFPKHTSTTKTYENFVKAVKNKNMKLTVPKVGQKYKFASCEFEILAPNSSEYDSANNYSVVVKLTYKNNSFLFTGDAETESENEMLAKNLDLKADVLKIGHHGSKTSTSLKFLNAVAPKYAVISVGKDNSYHHPTKTVIMRLKNANIPVYRTDESGTIIATSDGETIKFDKNQGSYNYAK